MTDRRHFLASCADLLASAPLPRGAASTEAAAAFPDPAPEQQAMYLASTVRAVDRRRGEATQRAGEGGR